MIYKFRGLDLNGNWYYGLVSNIMYGDDQGWFISNEVGSPLAYKVRPETVGQYTGLKDKNGVEIYEGDICTEAMWWELPRAIGFNCLGTVCSIDDEGSEYSFFIGTAANIEIIANIHENPELLEAKV